MEQKYLFDIHSEHTRWLNKLSFYRDEIKIMEGRLADVLSRNTGTEAAASGEQFQNRLIIQRDRIDGLAHDIKINEARLQQEIKSNVTASDHRKGFVDESRKQDIEYFETGFNEMRKEFIDYLTRWM